MATYAKVSYTGDGKSSNVQAIGFTPNRIVVVSTDSKAKVSNMYIVNATETVLVGLTGTYPTALSGILKTNVDVCLLDVQMIGLNIDGANYVLYAFA